LGIELSIVLFLNFQFQLKYICPLFLKSFLRCMKTIRASLRAILFVVYTTYHVLLVLIPAIFNGKNLRHALQIRQLLVNRLLKMLGVVVDKQGEIPTEPCMYVSNHRSYLDPIVLMKDAQVLPVAKAEMEKWPIIGPTTKLTGVVFVKRESKSSRAATLDAMRDTLKAGFSVLIYPEGTTHLLPTTIDFRAGAFNMAAKEGFNVVPVAIDFESLSDAWVGDELFVPHFMRCFGKKRTNVKIRYGQPLRSDDIDFLVRSTKQWIDENMLAIRQAFDAEKLENPI